MMHKQWGILLLLMICGGTCEAWAQEKSFTFGISPIYNPQVIEEGFKPVMKYLSERLKAPVNLLITQSYDDLSRKLKNGAVDFALLGPVQYVQAKEAYPELVYLATSQTTKFGQKRAYYFGHILVHKDSDITSISGLENKTFAFVNKQTTSGYSFPMVFFYNRGINPKTYFSRIFFAGTHEKAVDMLAKKTVDATTTHDINVWTAEEKYGKVFRTISKIGPIVSMALVAGHRVPPDIRMGFEEAMVNLPKAVIPAKFPYDGFQTLSDNSYDNVREVANFPFEDYFLPDILESAIKTGNLNAVFAALDTLKYSREKNYKVLTEQIFNKPFDVTGRVSGIVKNVSYGHGWYSLKKALVLHMDNDRSVYISLKKENATFEPGDTVTLNAKIIGTKDLDSAVMEIQPNIQ